MPPPKSMHARTRLITTVAHFLWSPSGCECFDRHQKCVGEVSLHFQLELNTIRFSSVSTGCRVEINTLLVCISKTNYFRTYIDMNFLPCLNSLLKFVREFKTYPVRVGSTCKVGFWIDPVTNWVWQAWYRGRKVNRWTETHRSHLPCIQQPQKWHLQSTTHTHTYSQGQHVS